MAIFDIFWWYSLISKTDNDKSSFFRFCRSLERTWIRSLISCKNFICSPWRSTRTFSPVISIPQNFLASILFNEFWRMAKIFTDLIFDILGDELFSDTYKVNLVDNVIYEVIGKVNLISEIWSPVRVSKRRNSLFLVSGKQNSSILFLLKKFVKL